MNDKTPVYETPAYEIQYIEPPKRSRILYINHRKELAWREI